MTVMLFVISCIIMAGCGDGSGDVSNPEGTEAKAVSAGNAAAVSTAAGDESESGYDSSTIVIYSPHDADPLNAGIIAFMAKYPQIKVEMVAGGTGELCNRIASEAGDPQADVFWGGGADSMQAYADYFESYVCENDGHISDKLKDPSDRWIGESPLPMVIIYNKKLLEAAGVSAPQSWDDCLDPAFRGRIAYCQPSKSGSAYTQLCTMLFAHGGEDAGWDYVEKFADNLDGKILDSSGKCHKLVASGDYMIGITIEKSAALYMDDPNIGFSYPSDGTSIVPDAVAVIRNCPHEENAKLFVNFVTSFDSQTEQCTDWNRRPSRDDVAAPAGLEDIKDIVTVDYDFDMAASMKEENIKRFNALMGIE